MTTTMRLRSCPNSFRGRSGSTFISNNTSWERKPRICHPDRSVHGLRPTQGDEKRLLFSHLLSLEAPPSPLSSRPERSVVEGSLCGCSFLEVFFDRAYPNSCFATSDRSACAAFIKESRMKFASATSLYRNSGERSGGICGAPETPNEGRLSFTLSPLESIT
jgi:hypothetical protein